MQRTAPVAQWSERLPSKQRVAGSSPAGGAGSQVASAPSLHPFVVGICGVRRSTYCRRLLPLILAGLLASACGEGDSRVASGDVGVPLLIDPAPPGMEVAVGVRGEHAGFFKPVFKPVEVYGEPDGDPFDDDVYVVTTNDRGPGQDSGRYLQGVRQYVDDLDEVARADVGELRVVEVGGVEGIVSTMVGPFEGRLSVAWPVGPEALLVVASTTATADELVAVAQHVSLAPDERPVVVDDAGLRRIGGLAPDIGERSSLTSFVTVTPDGVQNLSVLPATPEEQVAYRALMPADPAREYRTAASCCDPNLLHPPRPLQVGGRAAHVGALTTLFRALVVGGDPGVVVFSGGNRLGPLLSDEQLVAVAENLRPSTAEEVDAISDRNRREALEESADEAVRSLEQTYPGVRVVERVKVRDRELVLAAGSFAERGPDGGPGTVEPHLCAQYFGDEGFGLGCIGQSRWRGVPASAVGWYEGVIVVGDERLASVSLTPPGGTEIEGTVVRLDLGPDYPARIGFVFASVELQVDPEVDTRSGVPVVARTASGEELLRASVLDLPSG